MGEKTKMLAGELYCPKYDAELATDFRRAEELQYRFNNLAPGSDDEAAKLLSELFGRFGQHSMVRSPFRCDYGLNIFIGDDCYVNYGCVFLDCATITIGNNVLFGPQCGIYTATHPLEPALRMRELEAAAPVVIEDNVWIGGGVRILPNVTIGANSVIGSGAVVNKSIPAGVIAVGNPCRVLREITEDELREGVS